MQPLQFIENLATQPDYVFKILVVGNSYVGKSSFLMRLCTNAFSARYSSTIGEQGGREAGTVCDIRRQCVEFCQTGLLILCGGLGDGWLYLPAFPFSVPSSVASSLFPLTGDCLCGCHWLPAHPHLCVCAIYILPRTWSSSQL